MGTNPAWGVILALFASFVLACLPARAEERPGFAAGSTCHVSADPGVAYADYARQPTTWQCDGKTFDWKKHRFLVRRDITDWPAGKPLPRFAEFDRHPFELLTVSVIARDGQATSRSYRLKDVAMGKSSMHSIIALPEIAGEPVAIVFDLDGGRFPEALAAASLVRDPSVRIVAGLPHLIAALLCGLLITPLLFDLGYFRALREPFPLYHALFCVMAFIQTAAVSGLIPIVTPITYRTEMWITYLTLDAMLIATYLFARSFVENETLGRSGRSVLTALIGVTFVNGLGTALWTAEIGKYVDHIYFGTFMACLGAYFAVLLRAWRRGSRAAPYLALGLAPLALVQFAQSASVFISPGLAFDETWPQNLTMLFEVIFTALAVADRFISVRRERDNAIDEARILSDLSEHDSLTGLLNRRALDSRFGSLVEDGFTVMAIIDIDHFKAINDVHGHPLGDRVLQCAARALESGEDGDCRAFRIGGEEFLLLMRGRHAESRAEQRRRAISVRVASNVEALDRPVTASMGLVDFAAIATESGCDFSALYSRADWLLYEAKRKGRNRAQSEMLSLFEKGGEGLTSDENAASAA